jgi:hypothetical protein|tara:strand:- start:334 stop:612 length:279 start_codon:yes stop_codon:yes gene_type:complete
MIQYKGKDLEELNFNECIEFEKELLKKVLGAARAGMGEDIIHQLNVFVDMLRHQKAECVQKEMEKSKNEIKPDGIVFDTDPPVLEIIDSDDE